MTTTILQTWSDQALGAVRNVAARPGALFCLLLALNSLARPYAPLLHDAKLYAVQVLNHLEPGSYGDDLFLRFGSQDQFSLFSRVAAPLAGLLGVELTFFLLYLVFNALFLLALMRFIERLVTDRVLSTFALIFLAVIPLPFGGHAVFNAHEPFLTPRIMANSFVLFGLDGILQKRFGRALIFTVLAGLMHPLMAFGGCMIWAGCLAVENLGRRRLLWLGGTLGVLGLAVLAIPPLGFNLFGSMDEDWRLVVRHASAYNFPDEWYFSDWLNVAVSLLAVLGVGLLWRDTDPRRSRFLLVVAGAGAVGLLGTVLGSFHPYALLFQGQPYRVLWILKVLQFPLGLLLACHLIREKTAPGAGLLLFAYFGVTNGLWLECFLPLLFFPIVTIAIRGLEKPPARADWFVRTGAISLVLGFLVWAVFKAYLLWNGRHELLARFDLLDYVRTLLENIGIVVWLFVILAVLIHLGRGNFGPAFTAGALGVALACQLAWFAVPTVPHYRENLSRYGQDVDFVRNFLQERRPSQSPLPTVYCFMGRAEYLWVDMRAKSYFDWAQIVGVLFNRRTAMEGHRRAQIVAPFEIDRIQEAIDFMPDSVKRWNRAVYQADLDRPPPGLQDLERLCREGGLDYAVLKQEFPGLAAAGNGRIYIYDCRQVRAALKLASPTAVAQR